MVGQKRTTKKKLDELQKSVMKHGPTHLTEKSKRQVVVEINHDQHLAATDQTEIQ